MIQNFPSKYDPEYWKQGCRPSHGHAHGCHELHLLRGIHMVMGAEKPVYVYTRTYICVCVYISYYPVDCVSLENPN